ncbi:MAG: signal peptidase II [Alphaproteobacteria bacterium]|nr:signal peptidase II [Alphaproteobacteria bacterium]
MAIGLAISLAIFVLDQWSKNLVLKQFSHEGQAVEITSFFNLVLVWNHGISFGMLAGHNQPMMLAGMACLISFGLLVWMWREKSLFVTSGLGLVIGGAIGNSIDRLNYGAVVDFLDFHLMGYHWPAFNIADSAIFIGVVVLCIHSMFMQPSHLHKGTTP